MVKFIYPALLLGAAFVNAGKHVDRNSLGYPVCPPDVVEGADCSITESGRAQPGYCIHEENGQWYCKKLDRSLETVHATTREDGNIIEGRCNSENPEDCTPPERRNTYTWCAIPIHGVIYKEVPIHLQPIVEKCTHNPSGNVGDESRISNSTVGVNKEVCKLRCPDHRMDPMFVSKETKEDNRVFQVTCMCQMGPKGPGKCGWKTTGSGTKEFAGGNLSCRYTHFATKPIMAPSNYPHPDDLEVLQNWAATKSKKVSYTFNNNNFEVIYVTSEKYEDEKSGKTKTHYVPMEPGQHQYWEESRNNAIGTGIQMFPTDLIMENDKGKNDNQHNKIQKAINVRAIVKCRAHTDDRFFFILYPACKNKRHVLKKGRPGTCGWRIAEIQPNPRESFVETDLGYDPDYPVGKPIRYTGKIKNVGFKSKKGESAIGALQQASKLWRCPDYVENKN